MSVIESKLSEKKNYKPNKDFAAKANIKKDDLNTLISSYVKNPHDYWEKLARDYISWSKDFTKVVESCHKDFVSENLRLLYVALTRASQYLIISAHSDRDQSNNNFHDIMYSIVKENSLSEENEKEVSILNLEYADRVKFFEPSSKPERFSTKEISNKYEMNYVPFEVSIINPHKQISNENHIVCEYSKQKTDKYSERVASSIGSFIHSCFEKINLGQDILIEKCWRDYVELNPVFWGEDFDSNRLSRLGKMVSDEIYNTIEHPDYQKIFLGVDKIIPEMKISYFRGRHLVNGSMDLFIKYSSNKILVLDYKTSEVQKDSNLSLYCREQGYEKQLFQYSLGIRKLYSDCEVSAGIWFSKIQKLELLC